MNSHFDVGAVVEHHTDAFGIGVVDVDKISHALGEVRGLATLPSRSPESEARDEDPCLAASPDGERAESMHAFNDKVAGDTRVQPIMLPIRDGVSISGVL